MLPDRSLLIGQKLVENAKIEKFKCDILSNFQTLSSKVKVFYTCSINEGNCYTKMQVVKTTFEAVHILNEGIYLLKVQCMSNGKSEATTMGSNSQAEPFTAGGPYDSSIFIMEHSTLLQEISPLFSPFRYRMTGQVLAIFL